MSEKKHTFDDPKNIKKLLYVFYAICLILFSIDLFFHRHVIHPWESLTGFYAVYGLVACVILVLVAKEMRKILMRAADYFEGEHKTDDEVGLTITTVKRALFFLPG